VQGPGLSNGTLQGLIIPLLVALIIEGAAGPSSGAGHGERRGTADRVQNVVEHAVDTLKVLAQKLPWPQYLNLLSRFLKV
jgi:hypothetical protein